MFLAADHAVHLRRGVAAAEVDPGAAREAEQNGRDQDKSRAEIEDLAGSALVKAGGDIYIGRDQDTNVLAAVGDVRGAQLESKGGFVETSGQHLMTTGTRVLAKNWLLDPTEIRIVAADTATPDTQTVTSGGTLTAQDNTGILASEVLKSTIETAINNGTNVTISTANPTVGADGSGNITVETPLNFNNTGAQAATLRLFAVNGITGQAHIV